MKALDMAEQGWRAPAARLDEADFPELVRSTRDGLHRTLARIVGDDAAAEDLLQDTYLRALTRLDQYRGQGSPEAWLRGIATRLALNHLRARRLRRWLGRDRAEFGGNADSASAAIPDPAPDPERRAGQAERRRRLRELLARQPARAQAAFALRFLEDRPHAEVAALLGCSEATSRSLVSRTLSRLEREIHARGWRDDG